LRRLRSVSVDDLPVLSRSRRTGSFRMSFERDVIAAQPALLTHIDRRAGAQHWRCRSAFSSSVGVVRRKLRCRSGS